MPERPTHRPAIVVAAYKRAHSLSRLLSSIAKGHFPAGPVTLHISIDKGPSADVRQVAEEFEWPHGPKFVDEQVENLGLKAHLLHCGSLAKQYGNIILLEDDLFVAPAFYKYACEALAEFASDDRIAGISLYHYEAAESCRLPFRPVETGHSCYFMQWTSSWGQAWTAQQWGAFEAWLGGGAGEERVEKWLPAFVRNWESGSWKRLHIAFLRATGRYFVYPRASLSTHFGEPGTHSVLRGADQTPLLTGLPDWSWEGLDESTAVYDAWFELQPECLVRMQPDLEGLDFDVDLYGAKEKEALGHDLVLTSRKPMGNAMRSWAMDLLPPIANVLQGLEGKGIYLLKKEEVNFEEDAPSEYLAKAGGWHKAFMERGKVKRKLRISVVVTAWEENGEMEKTLAEMVESEEVELLWVGRGKGPLGVWTLEWGKGDLWDALAVGFDAAGGDLLYWLAPGQAPSQRSLREVCDIAQAYPEVAGWLLQPVGQPLSEQRWTQDRFARTRDAVLYAQLGPGMAVLRREHWLKVRHNEANEALPLYWAALFRDSLPIPAEIKGPSMPEAPLPWPPEGAARRGLAAKRSFLGRLISRLFRPAFLRNGRLRWIHFQIEQYPPVVRRNPEKASGWDMSQF